MYSKRTPTKPLPKSFQPRVISGRFKGARLQVPRSSRPITDRIKQSVFDSLMPVLPGAVVLDLFAGSGALGVEALSRGAASADFVESDEQAFGNLNENLAKIVKDAADWHSHNMTENKYRAHLKKKAREKFTLVFADPPFPTAHLFKPDQWENFIEPGGVFVVRLPSSYKGPRHAKKFGELFSQTYGESIVYFYQLPESGDLG